jgi:hypothetical protein
MMTMENNYPVVTDNENKIKIKPELMIKEKLYPFIHEKSVFLFFKDENELIHCYEISDKDVKEKMLNNPDNIIDILKDINKLNYEN